MGFLDSTCVYTHTQYFFPYRALTVHQGVEDEIAEEVELTSVILWLTTSYLTEAFLLPEVINYYTTSRFCGQPLCVRGVHSGIGHFHKATPPLDLVRVESNMITEN